MEWFLACLVLLLCFSIACWDLGTTWGGFPNKTVSAIIQEWARQFPMLPLAVGVVIGHVFWPVLPPPGPPPPAHVVNSTPAPAEGPSWLYRNSGR